MFRIKSQKLSLFFLLIAASYGSIWSDNSKTATKQIEECCEFNSRLKITELCADKLNVDCANLTQISGQTACVSKVCSDLVCTKNLNVSQQFSAAQITATTLCANTVTGADIFSTGTIYSNNFNNKYRATAVFSVDTTYTLGTTLNFDTILDDPNSNISFSPTKYTAPLSGYYMVTLQVDQHDLITSTPILGLPVANVTMLVNGITQREVYTPYLSFLNQQKTTFSALVSLNVGDEVSFIYDLLAMDQTSGIVQIPGTVVVEGNGTESNKSIFKILYLSSNGVVPTPPTCPTTPPVDCSSCVCTPCCQPKICDSNGSNCDMPTGSDHNNSQDR